MERIIGTRVDILEPIYITEYVSVKKVKNLVTDEILCMKEF